MVTMFVDDNRHYRDEENRSGPREFETVDAALVEGRKIVDDFLAEAHEPGMTAGELFALYRDHGEDPWIVPNGDGPTTVVFSAWTYARERSEEICGIHKNDQS
jgi:hypothetical protein